MKDRINIGVIGLGQRGSSLLVNNILKIDEYNVIGLCDSYEDRSVEFVDEVVKKTGVKPFTTIDYKELIDLEGIDAVLISCSWEDHVKVANYALLKHVAVGLEVSPGFSTEELWSLVKTEEETNTPFMFLENCCFDRSEALITKMARANLFGEIVYMSGSYGHDLREEIANGEKRRHYRLRNYINRNMENYPTHEIGPIAKILKINRGNRFVSLVSVGSKSVGMKEYINNRKEEFPNLVGTKFNQSDVVFTLITCENGETIMIKLDTTLPKTYSRDFTIHGTKGNYEANTNMVFFDGDKESYETTDFFRDNLNNAKKFEEEYLPEFWKNLTEEQANAGHGGMDYFEFKYFAKCLLNGTKPLIDVYDAATWMEISVLSEKSIAQNGAPQLFTDFTCGKYKTRENEDLY